MFIPNDYYLLIDLEVTCSNDSSLPRHEMEMIEIGAVMQNAHTFEVESEFQTFICPIRHPQLTAFCTELTTITQTDVDQAPRFPVAIATMQEWMYQFDNSLFCSWGDYDRHQFVQDCRFHGVGYPFLSGHLNLKPEFSRSLDIKKKIGLAQALRMNNVFNVGSIDSDKAKLDQVVKVRRMNVQDQALEEQIRALIALGERKSRNPLMTLLHKQRYYFAGALSKSPCFDDS